MEVFYVRLGELAWTLVAEIQYGEKRCTTNFLLLALDSTQVGLRSVQ